MASHSPSKILSIKFSWIFYILSIDNVKILSVYSIGFNNQYTKYTRTISI